MRHAPAGGVSIGGDRYEGGQFLPEEDAAKKRRSAERLDRLYGAIRPGRNVVIETFSERIVGTVIQVRGDEAECRYKDGGWDRREWFPLRAMTPNDQAKGPDGSGGTPLEDGPA
jgi:hypothetical protein